MAANGSWAESRSDSVSSLRRLMLVEAQRAADVFVMLVAFAGAFALSAQTSLEGFADFLAVRISLKNALLFSGFALVWHLTLRACGLYRSHRIGGLVSGWWEVGKAVVLGTLLLSFVALLFDLSAIDQRFLVTFFSLALLGTLLIRVGLRVALVGIRRRGRNLRNLVIVGCGPRGALIGKEVRDRPELGYLLLGYVDDMEAPQSPLHEGKEKLLGSLNDFGKLCENLQIDEVFVALPLKSYYEEIAALISLGEQLGLTVRIPADTFDRRLARANVDYLDEIPLLTLETPRPAALELAIKRLIDLVGSAAALLAFSPLFLAVAVAIKTSSPGPVFYVQERIGLGLRRFRLIKFRTMCEDAEERQGDLEQRNEIAGAAFKMRRDPRVTSVGRFLRKYSLDELPQFFNVLVGDLSLVGPRPLPVRDVKRFEDRWQRRRFSVKPGLTCLWQVNGRHEIGFEHWMELDLEYIDHWSLKLDIDIMLKTVPAILWGRGSY